MNKNTDDKYALIENLYEYLLARAKEDDANSYTAKLLRKGEYKIAKKIGEEATELVIEAIKQDRERMISETADLLYHLTVLLIHSDITPQDIAKELQSRQSQTGIEEKQSRNL